MKALECYQQSAVLQSFKWLKMMEMPLEHLTHKNHQLKARLIEFDQALGGRKISVTLQTTLHLPVCIHACKLNSAKHSDC